MEKIVPSIHELNEAKGKPPKGKKSDPKSEFFKRERLREADLMNKEGSLANRMLKIMQGLKEIQHKRPVEELAQFVKDKLIEALQDDTPGISPKTRKTWLFRIQEQVPYITPKGAPRALTILSGMVNNIMQAGSGDSMH